MGGELPGGLGAQPVERQDIPVGVDDADSIRAHQTQPPVRGALRQRWPVWTEQHELVHRLPKLVFLRLPPEPAQPAGWREADVKQG